MSNFYSCATERALKYHMSRNEPCRTCKEWWAKIQAQGAPVVAPPAPRKVAQCGTPSGYKKHKRLKQEACQPCLEAMNADTRKRKAAAKPKHKPAPRTLMPCGTVAAYSRHKRNNEEPCEPCYEALRANKREVARDRARKKAEAQA